MTCASKEIISGRKIYLNGVVREISEMSNKLKSDRLKTAINAELRDEYASQIGQNVQVPEAH